MTELLFCCKDRDFGNCRAFPNFTACLCIMLVNQLVRSMAMWPVWWPWKIDWLNKIQKKKPFSIYLFLALNAVVDKLQDCYRIHNYTCCQQGTCADWYTGLIRVWGSVVLIGTLGWYGSGEVLCWSVHWVVMADIGLVEVLWKRDSYMALLNAVLLAKCIHAHVWENSHYVSKQLTGIGT